MKFFNFLTYLFIYLIGFCLFGFLLFFAFHTVSDMNEKTKTDDEIKQEKKEKKHDQYQKKFEKLSLVDQYKKGYFVEGKVIKKDIDGFSYYVRIKDKKDNYRNYYLSETEYKNVKKGDRVKYRVVDFKQEDGTYTHFIIYDEGKYGKIDSNKELNYKIKHNYMDKVGSHDLMFEGNAPNDDDDYVPIMIY